MQRIRWLHLYQWPMKSTQHTYQSKRRPLIGTYRSHILKHLVCFYTSSSVLIHVPGPRLAHGLIKRPTESPVFIKLGPGAKAEGMRMEP